MNEDIDIINTSTRIEKIKRFTNNNKKKIIISISIIILILISYFSILEINERKKVEIGNKYNLALINFNKLDQKEIVNQLVKIIEERDKTYSPLALYFMIDNELIESNEKINQYFDIIINETSLEKEIKNLIIYKKALFNSDFETEDKLLNIINPLINTESIWKTHALFLMGEYFYSKGEKQKSKEFYEKIINLKNSNSKIKLETQKRIQRDFSE